MTTTPPTTSQANQELIERLANALHARHLATPAVLMLELLKPWRFVIGQILLMSEPLWAPLGYGEMSRYSRWIEEDSFDALLKALEAPSTTSSGGHPS